MEGKQHVSQVLLTNCVCRKDLDAGFSAWRLAACARLDERVLTGVGALDSRRFRLGQKLGRYTWVTASGGGKLGRHQGDGDPRTLLVRTRPESPVTRGEKTSRRASTLHCSGVSTLTKTLSSSRNLAADRPPCRDLSEPCEGESLCNLPVRHRIRWWKLQRSRSTSRQPCSRSTTAATISWRAVTSASVSRTAFTQSRTSCAHSLERVSTAISEFAKIIDRYLRILDDFSQKSSLQCESIQVAVETYNTRSYCSRRCSTCTFYSVCTNRLRAWRITSSNKSGELCLFCSFNQLVVVVTGNHGQSKRLAHPCSYCTPSRFRRRESGDHDEAHALNLSRIHDARCDCRGRCDCAFDWHSVHWDHATDGSSHLGSGDAHPVVLVKHAEYAIPSRLQP